MFPKLKVSLSCFGALYLYFDYILHIQAFRLVLLQLLPSLLPVPCTSSAATSRHAYAELHFYATRLHSAYTSIWASRLSSFLTCSSSPPPPPPPPHWEKGGGGLEGRQEDEVEKEEDQVLVGVAQMQVPSLKHLQNTVTTKSP